MLHLTGKLGLGKLGRCKLDLGTYAFNIIRF